MTERDLRGEDVFSDALTDAKLKLPNDLGTAANDWGKKSMPSAPNLVVPGVHAASAAFFNLSVDVMDFYQGQHRAHPDVVRTDGTQYVIIPGLLPNPAGIIPPDSRPLILKKFSEASVSLDDSWWDKLAASADIPGIKDARKTFASSATYPDWFVNALHVVARVVWPSVRDATVHIKRASVTGLPDVTSDIVDKARIVQMWGDNAQDILDRVYNDLRSAASMYGVVLCNTSGYRLQEEGTYADGRATPIKERPILTWRGDIMPMGRRILTVKSGWDERLITQRLTPRSRQIAAGALRADLPLRCMVRPMIEGRLAAWSSVYTTRSLDELRAFAERYSHIAAYDIGNNDQSQGRAVVRAVANRADELHGGGGWLLDLFLRAPIFARADSFKDRGSAWLSGNPFVEDHFDAHYMVSSGNPFTGEITQEHGTVQACFSIWVYDRYIGAHREPFDEAYVNEILSGRHPVGVRITGDNLLFGTSSPKYSDFVQNAQKYCLFALLERSPTYAGYVLYEQASGTGSYAEYNIDSLIRRTFFHDRSLTSPLRGDPMLGWTARQERFALHPLGSDWIQFIEEVSRKHFGSSLTDLYARASKEKGEKEGETPPALINLTEVEREFIDDPDVVAWKYSPDAVRPELLRYAFVNVDTMVVKAVLQAIKRQGIKPFKGDHG